MNDSSIVNDIKDRISLPDLVGRDVQLQQRGGKYTACCPFHSEKTPSFYVFEDHYHCFSCGAHGDHFTWAQKRQSIDFREALRLLAREAGVELRDDAEAQKRREEHLSRVAVFRKVAEFYHTMLTPEAREYLHQRGFRDDFIDSYLLGFAPGDSLDKTGIPTSDLQRWGLANQDGRDTLYNRIVFPIWGRYEDEVIGFNGRAWPQVDRKPKYMAAPAGVASLINERGLRGAKAVYLAEGDSDCATLVQAGLPVVGVRGTQGLKDEYKALFGKCETVYVCADADEPGLALMHSAGRLLGNKARIVMLPDGEDVNSWVGQKGNDIVALAEKAPAYVDWLIEGLKKRYPEGVPADQVEREVKEFIPALKPLGKTAQDAYSKALSRVLGVSVAPVREELRLAIEQNGNGHSKNPLKDAQIIWQQKAAMNPAQDLVEGVMYTTVFLDKMLPDPETGIPKLKRLPHIINSRREVFELTEQAMFDRGLRYSETKVPIVGIISDRWHIAEQFPHGLKSYVDGGVSVSPWDVYTEVAACFRRHVSYPNPLYYDYLALWTIGTYWFYLFQAYPYNHLNGTKRCGKTLTMEIINELAFNTVMSTSLSSAAAYRTIEACSSTMLLDEAENLQKQKKDAENGDDKIEILKSGYKKGLQAIRCTGDNHEPKGFDVYSPKCFGSIGNIDRILGDRTITLGLVRKSKDVQLDEFVLAEQSSRLHLIRDKLYILMLEYGKEIAERRADGIKWQGVTDRNREIWTPILVLAEFFDDARLEEQGADSVAPEDLLLFRMRQMASEDVVARQAEEALDQREVMMIEATWAFIQQQGPIAGTEDWYTAASLLEFVKGVEGLGWVEQARMIYQDLAKVGAISKTRDLGRRSIAGVSKGKQVRCIRLDKKKLEEAASRFGANLLDSKDSKTANPGGVPALL